MNERWVAVPYNEYRGLLAADMLVSMLERDGVDNWKGYGVSFNDIVTDWLCAAGVSDTADDFYTFTDVVDRLLQKAEEDGTLILLEMGDDEGNE